MLLLSAVGAVCAGCGQAVEEPLSTRPPATAGSALGDAEVADATVLGTSGGWQIGPVAAVYYATSPAQGRPPDGEIPAGTPVELREAAGSYSLVAWGEEAVWVASDALVEVKPAQRKIHKIETH
jgi:hypothetical protein